VLAPLLALVLALALAPAAGAAEVRAGPVEVRGAAFRTPAGWFHATRLLARADGRLTFATDHPAGRRLELRLRRSSPGVVELTARAPGAIAMRAVFGARPGEGFLGFGERSNAVDQRGNEVESYVAEGPFEEDERPAVPAFVPAWGFHPRDDATYFPMPWLLSTRGYGVLVDNAETSVFRLSARRSWQVDVESGRLRLRVFAGPRPADVLRRLTARIGRQPRPPGAFVFGPWYQPRGDERAQPVSLFERHAVAVTTNYNV
jgi:alpha-glucosidase (family GH31 glycosyl hydrolase)